jgi:hypothetical protein
MTDADKTSIALLSVLGTIVIFFLGVWAGNCHVKRCALANNCAHLTISGNTLSGNQFVWGPRKD